jgi:hypothetical protein
VPGAPRSLAAVIALVAFAAPARADELAPSPVTTASGSPSGSVREDTPVFAGHPHLTIRTKEVAFEGSFVRLGDGTSTFATGAAVSTFYKPWLSLLGAAHAAPGFFGSRETYDTRAVARLIWPEPFFDRLFLYVGAGATIFFFEDPKDSKTWKRAAGAVAAVGAFVQVADRFRVRLEVRDHFNFLGQDGLPHNVFVTLSLVSLYR